MTVAEKVIRRAVHSHSAQITVEQLKATLAKEKATIAQQQKQIEALAAVVEQVSDQIGLTANLRSN